MCDYIVSKYIHKCQHEVKRWVRTERCADAQSRGSDCTGDDLKEKEIGSTRRRDDCEQCNDEGYSRN
jgi:hypothetical protein